MDLCLRDYLTNLLFYVRSFSVKGTMNVCHLISFLLNLIPLFGMRTLVFFIQASFHEIHRVVFSLDCTIFMVFEFY